MDCVVAGNRTLASQNNAKIPFQGKIYKENGSISWEFLLHRLSEIFENDCINIEEVEETLSLYKSDPRDWLQYAKFDKYKYTRNLVHEGNGKFNLMVLCWAIGNQSPIHDHSDAHCFVKVLDGTLREIRFHWPNEVSHPDGSLVEKDIKICKKNDISYMSDKLGLHRVQNTTHSDCAVSLHLYSPPFGACQIFDERTGKKSTASMTFWSKFGNRSQNHESS